MTAPLKQNPGVLWNAQIVAELGFTTLSGWSPECVYFLNLDGVEPVGTRRRRTNWCGSENIEPQRLRRRQGGADKPVRA